MIRAILRHPDAGIQGGRGRLLLANGTLSFAGTAGDFTFVFMASNALGTAMATNVAVASALVYIGGQHHRHRQHLLHSN